MNCIKCDRPALYYSHKKNKMRAAVDHDLCGRCWRDEMNRQEAKKLESHEYKTPRSDLDV